MITIDELRKIARCGSCGLPMNESKENSLVLLNARAEWDVPSWRIPRDEPEQEPLKAVGILCDRCQEEQKDPQEAIEIRGDGVVYHRIDELEVVDGAAGEKAGEKS